MCEYCGCQQIAVIGELTREHDAVVTLVYEIQGALKRRRPGEVVKGCHRILAVLAPHTVVEEEGLFPEMAMEFPQHIASLRSEHREIEKVLGEAGEGAAGFPGDPTWPGRLLDVLLLLRGHILKEQDGVFPAALAALDPDQWERIEAVRARLTTSDRVDAQ
jgi:hemerythrin-like domain-containing protein